MKKVSYIYICLMLFVFLAGCSNDSENKTLPEKEEIAEKHDISAAAFVKEKLPEDIVWLNNDSDPVFASDFAKKGGIMRSAVMTFPLTFRVVGPDSNSSFRGAVLSNQLSLIGIHPNTLNIIPELASFWAFGKDKKTMYFKLNPDAVWSDGRQVTAYDFAYTLEFMRSKHIIAPWYNDYFSKEIDRVIVYDKTTLAVVATKAEPDLHLKLALTPTPRHFYGKLDKEFVRKYNWEIVPNTGAYQISKFKKGKYIKFKRKKEWWAKDLLYFKNRFNVDTVLFTVIRDFNMLWEYFKKAKIDVFNVTLPKYWHTKAKGSIFENGYVQKIWFFNDTQRSASGMWLNMDMGIFKSKEIRYAFAYSLNMEKVIKKVLRDDFFRLEHGFVGYGPYSSKTVKAKRFNISKAAFYMKKAGWLRGADGIWTDKNRRFSVEVVYSHDEYTPQLVVLKEDAKLAGLEIRLQKLDSSASYKKIMEKKHQAAWMGWSTSLRPQYWEHFHSINAHKPQTNNITNTDDSEIDILIEKYRNSLSIDERVALSLEIQKKIDNICAFIPSFMIPYTRAAYWRWWKLPDVPGTRRSTSLFDPFSGSTGGLFWYDSDLHDETKEAMDKGIKFNPVTIIDKTYKSDK